MTMQEMLEAYQRRIIMNGDLKAEEELKAATALREAAEFQRAATVELLTKAKLEREAAEVGLESARRVAGLQGEFLEALIAEHIKDPAKGVVS